MTRTRINTNILPEVEEFFEIDHKLVRDAYFDYRVLYLYARYIEEEAHLQFIITFDDDVSDADDAVAYAEWETDSPVEAADWFNCFED